jgi:hypothetical protein
MVIKEGKKGLKRLASSIIVVLLFLSLFAFASRIQLTKAAEPPATEWTHPYGGANWDGAQSLVQAGDGGYVMAGSTLSYGAGGYDFLLVKTDANGNMQWNKPYGGSNDDMAYSVVQASDGGYAIAGWTKSYRVGGPDFCLVKTDASGNTQWSRTYGGTGSNYARSVVRTSDGGYAIAGFTSPGGSFNFMLVKTDASGNMQWSKTYGGDYWERAYSVVQTSDGGYALAGYTESYGAGSEDFWLVKTDSSGNMQWNKAYGGTNIDDAYSVVQTSDGGYALAGDTASHIYGKTEAWLVKTDTSGNMQWSQTYGMPVEIDIFAYSVVQGSDGGYALAGQDWNLILGDPNYGKSDFWLAKTDASGNIEWSKTEGGTGSEYAYSLVQTSDGGYALAGVTNSFGAGNSDFWLVKIAPSNGGPPVDCGWPVLVAPVQISSNAGYNVGDTLTVRFTIQNQGTAAIHLDKLLLGGRFNGGTLPGGGFPDFSYSSVTLQVGQTYQYEGTLYLTDAGYYQFFVAYYIANPTEAEKQLLDPNNWNTCIDLAPGLTDSDRTWNRSVSDWTPLPQTIPIIGKGVWIWHIWEEGSLDDIIGRLKSAKVRWVAIKCGDGNQYWPEEKPDFISWVTTYGGFTEVVKKFRQEIPSISVLALQFAYGYNAHYELPDVTELDVANKILNIPGIAGLLINAENDTMQAAIDNYRTYLMGLRSTHPNDFIAYNSYDSARPDWTLRVNFHDTFTEYCDASMPEVYWTVSGRTPTQALSYMESPNGIGKLVQGKVVDRWHEKPIMPMGISGPAADLGSREIYEGEIREFCDTAFAHGYSAVSLYAYHIMHENWKWNEYSGCFNPDTTIRGQCPIDLAVTDPDGLIINKTLNQVPGALYLESDPNGNNDTVVEVSILHKKLGDYFVTVIPQPDASSNDTYSLDFSTLNLTATLAQNVSIGDIPSESYAVTLTETTIVPRTAAHDIGIDRFSALRTIIGQDRVASLDVKVRNYGDGVENFNLTLYLNSSIIANFENITLASRDSMLTTFRWNTTGLPRGSYTIDAVCSCVEGESYTDDNLKSFSIEITIPGDVNGDFIVNIGDAALVGLYWGQRVPPAPPNVDINGDTIINIAEAATIGAHWGERFPP